MTIPLQSIRESVAGLNLGRTGWGVVFSDDGYIIVHPDQTLIESRTSVFDVVEADDGLRAAVEDALGGGRGFIERANTLTGQDSWFSYEPVAASGWTVALVTIQDEIPVDSRSERRTIIWISILGIAGFALLAAWASAHLFSSRLLAVLWGNVIFCSLLLVGGIAVIRYVVYNQSDEAAVENVRIVDSTGLSSFLQNQMAGPLTAQVERPASIPTGVFVRSMDFTSADDILITGNIWQKLPASRTDSAPAFVLPDAVGLTLTEAYRSQEDGVETVGWRFEATFPQNMNISKYPLDQATATLRLNPAAFDRNQTLIPDLDSYTTINPTSLPGLDPGLQVPGWSVSSSFFDYAFEEYPTDFGIPGYDRDTSVPVLQFNVGLKRLLLDPSLRNGVPLFVVFIMLFAVLATATSNPDESKLVGFNPSGVTRITSTLFFAVLLSHSQLRESIQAQEFVFLEYLYVMAYIALLLTSLHRFLFMLDRFNVPVIQYRDSLIVKLSYWPTLLVAQFLITVLLFY